MIMSSSADSTLMFKKECARSVQVRVSVHFWYVYWYGCLSTKGTSENALSLAQDYDRQQMYPMAAA